MIDAIAPIAPGRGLERSILCWKDHEYFAAVRI